MCCSIIASNGSCFEYINKACKSSDLHACGEDEIRTRGTLIRFVGLANRWFQPLTHLSLVVAPTGLEPVYPA